MKYLQANTKNSRLHQYPTAKVLVATALLLLLASLATLISLTARAAYVSSDNPFPVRFKHGYVVARTVVLDPDTNEPVLVEFNTDGTEAGRVSTGGYSTSEVAIVPANTYRAYRQQLDAFEAQYANTLARDAELMTRSEFEQTSFLAADNTTVISAPKLPANIHSVLVRGQSQRLLPDPGQLVLRRFTLDMTQPLALSDDTLTLVVSKTGQVITFSSNNIGYRTGFFGDPDAPQDRPGYRVEEGDDVFGPVEGVAITGILNGGGVTDNNGRYSFVHYYPPCPPGGFNFSGNLTAEIRYRNFLPTGSPSFPYFLQKPYYDYCYAALIPGNTLQGLTAQIAVMGILAAHATPPQPQTNFFIDVSAISGLIDIRNLDGQLVPVGETTRVAFSEAAENTLQTHYDFNGDGVNDRVVQGEMSTITNADGDEEDVFKASPEGDLQGVFFTDDQEQPDFVRLIDQARRTEPVGTLESISTDDLRNTDVLVFRESTGQLIMERRGLKDSEINRERTISASGLRDDHQVAYRVFIRGQQDFNINIGAGNTQDFTEWASDNQLTEPYQQRRADHIRPGEYIKVVAINRATGYMGTARTRVGSAAGQAGINSILTQVPGISLRPPNLKLWAERQYTVEQGLTAGDERRYTIGSEGAALTSDTTITIYSEWLDEHGQPLPEELGLDKGEQYGLTGRLAKVVAPNQLDAVGDSDLAEFAIAPGRQTQVIRVASNLSRAEHFYLHVIGKAKDQETCTGGQCLNFTDTGRTAPYNHRPQKLVPFLVPLPDEDRSWQTYNAYRQLQRDFDSSAPDAIAPQNPLPAFTWQYRPEYQFSQYELAIQAINRVREDEQGNPQNLNILDVDNPAIASSDDYLEAFYSLISSDFQPLAAIDGPQELILALGEEEQRVTIGADQSIRFHNLEHLANLEPEDFLLMRLYANNDARNVLWEFAFTTLDVDIDSDNNNGFDLPDRSQAEEDVEAIANYPGKIIDVNDGDVNDNDVPDFAEFVYLDSNNQSVDMRFVPFVIEIPPEADLATTTLRLSYSGSDPQAVTSQNNGTADNPDIVYSPAAGTQRIWKTNANEQRNPVGVQSGGDYITPDYAYKVSDLGFHRFNLVQVFYIEGIQKTESGAAQIRMILEYN